MSSKYLELVVQVAAREGGAYVELIGKVIVNLQIIIIFILCRR